MKFSEAPGSSLPNDSSGWTVMAWIVGLFFWNVRDFIFDVPHDPTHLVVAFLCVFVVALQISLNRLTAIIRGLEGK